MQKLCILFALVCMIAHVDAAAAIYPYEPKPDEFACEEGCYIKSLNRVLPYNQPHYPAGKCEVYKCQPSNQTYWYSCGVIAVKPECTVVQDLSRRYPDCCGKPVCPMITSTTTETNCDGSSTEAPSSTEGPPCRLPPKRRTPTTPQCRWSPSTSLAFV